MISVNRLLVVVITSVLICSVILFFLFKNSKNSLKVFLKDFIVIILRFWATLCIISFPGFVALQFFAILFCDNCNSIDDAFKPLSLLWLPYVIVPIFFSYFFLNKKKERVDKVLAVALGIEFIGLFFLLYF